jgi:hypothetical protein
MVSPEQLGERYLTVYHRMSLAVAEGTTITSPARPMRSHVQDEPGGRAQPGGGARAQVSLLVQLLRVTAPGEVAVQCTARLLAAVACPAVP